MSNLKIKGRQKPRHPPTPYERTKRLVSKVRDWLTPVLWGTPKARLEDEELDRVGENDENISEQPSGSLRAQDDQPSRSGVPSESSKMEDQGLDSDSSFVKEASDEEDSALMEDQDTPHPQHVSASVRTRGGVDNGLGQETAAEVSALRLDRKVNQLLSKTRTPVGKGSMEAVLARTPVGKGLLSTPVVEVIDNSRHTAAWPTQPTSQPIHNHEEHHYRSSTPTGTAVDSASSTIAPSLPPPPSHTSERLFSQPSTCTPARTDTEESIRNSPFQSPFYCGKTSYGGASALPQPRSKRLKADLTSSHSQVVHYTVKARSSSEQQPVASQTAKKILQTLETLSTPLSDARKFPLRTTPLVIGQAAKRIKHDQSAMSILSSPPATPLVIPSNHSRQQQGPVIVPSLDRGKGQPVPSVATVPLNRADGSPLRLAAINKPEALPLAEPAVYSGTPPLPNHAPTVSMPTASLAAIKFPSRLNPSPDKLNLSTVGIASTHHANQPASSSLPDSSFGRAAQVVSSSSSDSVLGAFGAPGKVKTHSRQHYSVPKDQSEDHVNTMEPPPPVPLKIGPLGSLPKFSFASSLVVSAVSSAPSATPASQSKSDVPKLGSAFSKPFSLPTVPPLKPLSLSTVSPLAVGGSAVAPSAGQFAFSAPKEVVPMYQPRLPHVLTKTPVFTFSAPKGCETSSAQSLLSSRASLSTAPVPFSQPVGMAVRPPLPLLVNTSVLDALKKPEFQPLGKGTSISTTKKESVIDLTDDGDGEVEVHKPLQLAPPTVPNIGIFSTAGELKSVTSDRSKPEVPVQISTTKLGIPVSSSQSSMALGGRLKVGGGLSGLVLPTTAAATGQGKRVETLPPVSGLLTLPPPPSGSWECNTCMLQNKPEASRCVACATAKPAGSAPPLTDSSARSVVSGGAGPTKVDGLLSFVDSKAVKPLAAVAPSASWECQTCLVMNKAEDVKCVACSSPKSGTSGNLFQQKPQISNPLAAVAPSASWECQTCLVMNKAEDVKCVACSSPKSGTAITTSSGNLFQQKPQSSSPVVFGDAGGIKLSLGGGLKIAGITSLSSGAIKKEEPVKAGDQTTTSSSGLLLASGTLSSKLPTNGEGKTSEASGGVKIGFSGTLPAFSSGGFQLGLSKPGKEEVSKPAEDKPLLPTFSLGNAVFGAGVKMVACGDTKETIEPPKALLGGSLFAAAVPKSVDVTGGIKFAVPPPAGSQADALKSSSLFAAAVPKSGDVTGGIKFAVPPPAGSQEDALKSSVAASQPALTFNLNTLANSAASTARDVVGDTGSSQKSLHLPGVSLGTLPSLTAPSLAAPSLSSASSVEARPLLKAGISFAVPPSTTNSASTEPSTSTIKLSAATPQGGAMSSSANLFAAQQLPVLTFAGSSNSSTSRPLVGSFVGATAVASSPYPVLSSQQPSLPSFAGGASSLFSSQSSSALAAPSTFLPSKPSAPSFAGGAPNPFSSQSSMPSFAGGALLSSSSVFSNTTTAGSNVSFNFSAGKVTTTAESASKFGSGANPSAGMAVPSFKFGSGASEPTFNFSAGSKPAAAAAPLFNFTATAAAAATKSDKPLAGAFSASLDTSIKEPLFPKMAADINPQMNTGLVFGAPSLQLAQPGQLTQQGSGNSLSFNATPNFGFSGQQLQPSTNLAASVGMFGGGGGAQQQQSGALLFGGGQSLPQFGTGGGGGVPSVGGGPLFAVAPPLFMARQAAATANLSAGSNNDMTLGTDAGLFTPGASGGTRVFKKAVRKRH